MTPNDKIVVPVRINGETFRKFAFFDAFTRQKRWRSLALFSGILLFSALLCFFLRDRAENGILLTLVLFGIAILVPTCYVLQFYSSVNTNVKKMKLNGEKVSYTVTLHENGLNVFNQNEHADFAWTQLFAAYHKNDCIYIYATQQKAYLLPEGQGNVKNDEIWAYLTEKLAPEQLSGR